MVKLIKRIAGSRSDKNLTILCLQRALVRDTSKKWKGYFRKGLIESGRVS